MNDSLNQKAYNAYIYLATHGYDKMFEQIFSYLKRCVYFCNACLCPVPSFQLPVEGLPKI